VIARRLLGWSASFAIAAFATSAAAQTATPGQPAPNTKAPSAPPATPDDDFAPAQPTAPANDPAANAPANDPPANGTDPAGAKADPYAEPAEPPRRPVAVGPKEGEDPTAIPEGLKEEIGSNHLDLDGPVGPRSRTGLWPLAYKERIGSTITSALFPFYFDRRTFDADERTIDRETFAGLYYRRRSPKKDVDAAFPLFVRWRSDDTTTTVVPPVLFRDGPGEWHRWLAPLFFASSQKDGGYFHAPPLLTFSHHNPKRAFSLIGGLGFYDRTDKDVDWGVAPFVFGGSDTDKLTSYLLIPPLLTYHRADRDNARFTTVVGPVVWKTAPNALTFDILPFFLHDHDEDSTTTTLLPLFHMSRDRERSTLITPLFLDSRDHEGRTIVTPVYSRHRGRTTLDLVGPIVPLFVHYEDPDIHKESWLFGPIWTSSDPTGSTLLTPLFGHWREYGVSRTTWIFPTFHHETDPNGWSFNIHPLVYTGRDGDSTHSVFAPIWWDFASEKKRTTIAFPLFWRFRDDEGTTQVALNTLYLERPQKGGPSWDFHFLPVFHVGGGPVQSSWDVLFGLVGYKREGGYKQLKLFWIPIDLTKPPPAK
jgi:hypothetical protein